MHERASGYIITKQNRIQLKYICTKVKMVLIWKQWYIKDAADMQCCQNYAMAEILTKLISTGIVCWYHGILNSENLEWGKRHRTRLCAQHTPETCNSPWSYMTVLRAHCQDINTLIILTSVVSNKIQWPDFTLEWNCNIHVRKGMLQQSLYFPIVFFSYVNSK